MRSGRLKHKIRFERRGKARNGAGGSTECWQTVDGLDNINARIITRGSETSRGAAETTARDRQTNIGDHVIKVRRNPLTVKITTHMRIVNNRTGETYAIRGRWYDERRRVFMIESYLEGAE